MGQIEGHAPTLEGHAPTPDDRPDGRPITPNESAAEQPGDEDSDHFEKIEELLAQADMHVIGETRAARDIGKQVLALRDGSRAKWGSKIYGMLRERYNRSETTFRKFAGLAEHFADEEFEHLLTLRNAEGDPLTTSELHILSNVSADLRPAMVEKAQSGQFSVATLQFEAKALREMVQGQLEKHRRTARSGAQTSAGHRKHLRAPRSYQELATNLDGERRALGLFAEILRSRLEREDVRNLFAEVSQVERSRELLTDLQREIDTILRELADAETALRDHVEAEA